MITRYRISLNGTHLDSLLSEKTYGKNNTVITDIQYAEPGISRTIETPGDREGGIITKEYRQKASVTVTFMLRIYDVAKRNAACSAIKTWAKNGGNIVTNDREGQTLYNCVCEKYPDISSARNWLDPLSITFSAYSFPYWQETKETALSLTSPTAMSASNLTGKMDIPGNAPYAMVTADIKALAVNREIKITTGSTFIQLTGITLNTGNNLQITYDSNNNIKITHVSSSGAKTSWLQYRTAKSSDFLCLPCGKSSNISIASSSRIMATLKARGAWL